MIAKLEIVTRVTIKGKPGEFNTAVAWLVKREYNCVDSTGGQNSIQLIGERISGPAIDFEPTEENWRG